MMIIMIVMMTMMVVIVIIMMIRMMMSKTKCFTLALQRSDRLCQFLVQTGSSRDSTEEAEEEQGR